MASNLTDGQLDQLAHEFWRESRYSGRDGQDFDHRAFARACARMTNEALGREQINQMARSAGLPMSWLDEGKASAWPELERFARLVEAALGVKDAP